MTISESVVEWLKGYEGGFELTDAITTDLLDCTPEAYGIFKAPGGHETVFINGDRDVIVNYLFLARQPSQTDGLRQKAHAWLDGLEQWIRIKDMRRQLPALNGSRTCCRVRIANTYAAEEQNDAETVYQIGLEIDYIEEAER